MAMALSVLAAPGLSAQACLGGTDASRGWLAVGYGRASGDATVTSADFAWRLAGSLAVFGEGDATVYPAPDPRRHRLSLGGAYRVIRSSAVAVCLTSAFEQERIGDLRVVRVPIGVSLGWSTAFANGKKRLGLRVEPLLGYARESIAMFSHARGIVGCRTGLVLGSGRLMFGLAYECAFSDDSAWRMRARFGVAL